MATDHRRIITDWERVPVVMDIGMAAIILRMHPEYIRRAIKAGKLPGRKVLNEWRISKQELIDYLDGRWPYENDAQGGVSA